MCKTIPFPHESEPLAIVARGSLHGKANGWRACSTRAWISGNLFIRKLPPLLCRPRVHRGAVASPVRGAPLPAVGERVLGFEHEKVVFVALFRHGVAGVAQQQLFLLQGQRLLRGLSLRRGTGDKQASLVTTLFIAVAEALHVSAFHTARCIHWSLSTAPPLIQQERLESIIIERDKRMGGGGGAIPLPIERDWAIRQPVQRVVYPAGPHRTAG